MISIGHATIEEKMVIGNIKNAVFKKENVLNFKRGVYTISYQEIVSNEQDKIIINTIASYNDKLDYINSFKEVRIDNIYCTGYIGVFNEDEDEDANYIRTCSQNYYGVGTEQNGFMISTKRENHIVKVFVRRDDEKLVSIIFLVLMK